MEMTDPRGDFRASFDLTDFGDAETFLDLMGEHELEQNQQYDGRGFEYISVDGDVVMHTYNDPVTGEYADSGCRHDEEGYASYIHIIGEEEAVTTLFNSIEASATYIKESALGAWIV